MSQHDFEPVIGAIDALDSLSGRGPKCPKSLGPPGFDRYEQVVPSGYNGAEPARAHPAQAETLPVPMDGKVIVEQRGETHPLDLLEQQRDVVDALRDDVGYV